MLTRNASAKGRAHNARYKASAKGKANLAAYRGSEAGKLVQRARGKRYRRKYVDKIRARNALYRAIGSGIVQRPSRCEFCRTVCAPQGHHFDYRPGAFLTVSWLCLGCHALTHAKQG